MCIRDRPTDWPAKLLPSVCAAMPPEDAQRLLRQVLLADPRGSLTKRVAMAMLVSMGAPAPYAVWQDGRLGYVDPTQPPPQTASFYQRMITRCLNRAAALALSLIHILCLTEEATCLEK